jgi:aspartate kinase
MGGIVCKFGGSSLAESGQILKMEAIIRSDTRRRFLVVSAPGKRHGEDEKITDLLYACQARAQSGQPLDELFEVIRRRYLDIAAELGIETGIEDELDDVETRLAGGASPDEAASRGEYLCARLMAEYLDAEFVDAADVIRFAEGGGLDEVSYRFIAERMSEERLYVIPGFYGALPDGRVKTFSRGGSDITGAIVARGVGAEVYENWTDVSGFLMADPRIVSNPKPIHAATYREIRELAYMGAQVFHEEAIAPIYREKIPINIRNTNKPEDAGTLIVPERKIGEEVVVGIAGKKGYSLLLIEKFLLKKERHFIRRLHELLKKRDIASDLELVGIDAVTLIIPSQQIAGREQDLLAEIKEKLDPDRAEIGGDLALIAAVGEGMAYRRGVAARLFSALADAGINVRISDQGSSEINIMVGVDVQDYPQAVNAIYATFC